MKKPSYGIIGSMICLGLGGTTAHGWQPGYPASGASMASRGFEVDAADRDEAVAFWHAVYLASEGYENRVKWTGKFPSSPGTTSAAFSADVERRINYFRAMCRVPASARVNTGSLVKIQGGDRFKPSTQTSKTSACQASAMLIAASYDPLKGTLAGMTHDPDPSLGLWSAAAWNAAANGNLSFGSYGPGAIREYMVEELRSNAATSEWNSLVGHRRWLLVPGSTNYATGDFPGGSALLPPTNVLYVVQHSQEVVNPSENRFVCYPPAGYLPADLNGRFWSVSRKGADFTTATVRVTDASGATVPLLQSRANTSYGDPAFIWQVTGSAADTSVTTDRRFRVTLDGIQGDNVPSTLQYDVTLFHPYLLRRTAPISGPAHVALGTQPTYKVDRIAGARTSRVVQYQRVSKSWVEGGDGARPDVIDRTSSAYPLLATTVGVVGGAPISGTKSFNLTFPDSYNPITRSVTEQIMELGPWIQTKSGAKLEFRYRRGLMSDVSHLVVEASNDQGVTWKKVGSPIKGYADARPDVQIFNASYSLPASSSPQRIRFRYYFTVRVGPLTTVKDMPGFPTGIFLDDIQLIRCEWMKPRKTVGLKSGSFRFATPKGSKSGEQWAFLLESEFGGSWLPTGPFKTLRLTK